MKNFFYLFIIDVREFDCVHNIVDITTAINLCSFIILFNFEQLKSI